MGGPGANAILRTVFNRESEAFPTDLMKAWKVGKDVGNVKNDHPDLCVESLVGEDEAVPKDEPKKDEPKQDGLFE
jgi:hypothetical protein